MPVFLVYPVSVLAWTGPLWFIQMLFVFSIRIVLLKNMINLIFCGESDENQIFL